ncbi:MAG: flagellar basal body L-ring protein FlgH [Planctomycetota bacterium]
MPNKKHLMPAVCGLAAFALCYAGECFAQDSSLLRANGSGLAPQHVSFLYNELPPEARPRELAKNDIITVIVDYSTVFLSEGDAESRKTANLTAVLADWLRFDGKNLEPAPQSNGDPTISGNLNSQYRTESDIELRDSLRFRVAAKIVDIRPNGNLVLEAHQTINNNEEVWEISLTGVVRRESIQADRTVDSSAIAELRIVKNEEGQVRDGYARGWAKRFMDKIRFF